MRTVIESGQLKAKLRGKALLTSTSCCLPSLAFFSALSPGIWRALVLARVCGHPSLRTLLPISRLPPPLRVKLTVSWVCAGASEWHLLSICFASRASSPSAWPCPVSHYCSAGPQPTLLSASLGCALLRVLSCLP